MWQKIAEYGTRRCSQSESQRALVLAAAWLAIASLKLELGQQASVWELAAGTCETLIAAMIAIPRWRWQGLIAGITLAAIFMIVATVPSSWTLLGEESCGCLGSRFTSHPATRRMIAGVLILGSWWSLNSVARASEVRA